jgi:hypothetical protein
MDLTGGRGHIPAASDYKEKAARKIQASIQANAWKCMGKKCQKPMRQ